MSKNLSKFMSLVLRHKPKSIGIILDKNGWVPLNRLVLQLNKNGFECTPEQVKDVVTNDTKTRYTIRDGKIRANQGHSIGIDLGLTPETPPDVLYHGSNISAYESILTKGIYKMKRDHVHLSSNIDIALEVGARRGKPVLITIDTKKMFNDGKQFFLSENGVWLTDNISKEYFI